MMCSEATSRRPFRELNFPTFTIVLLTGVWLCCLPASSSWAQDCNSNGVEDAVDIAGGTGSDCDSNGLLDACESVLFVDDGATNGLNDGSSWQDAFIYLQDALAEAENNCAIAEIWVAAGTYTPDQGGGQIPGDQESTFQLQSGLAIYGGFAGTESVLSQRDIAINETVLEGDLLGDDAPVACTADAPDCDAFGEMCVDGSCLFNANAGENIFSIVTGSGASVTAVLDGFTITGGTSYFGGGGMRNVEGDPTVANCTFVDNAAGVASIFGGTGAGMANSSSNPRIINCAFIDNAASSDGGGIANLFSSPEIIGCTFTDNVSGFRGGGIANDRSVPTLDNSTFRRNRADWGGGVYNDEDSQITQCKFVGNSAIVGGGMMIVDSDPALAQCVFIGNHADAGGGGLSHNESNATVVNTVFSGNTANFGGGVLNDSGARPVFDNCSFSGNSANSSGGGMYNYPTGGQLPPAVPFVTNSILWGNTPNQTSPIYGQFRYCIIEGSWFGTGPVIVDVDPRFVDSDGADDIAGTDDDDLRLLPGSPAIDAGDNGAVPVGTTTDLGGDERSSDDINTVDTGIGPAPIVDMGAYEFQAGSLLFVDASAAGGGNDGSSWTDAYTHLQDALLNASTNSIVNQIWVAAGTYTPDQGGEQTPLDRAATFQLQSGLALYGGFGGTETRLDQRDIGSNGSILSGDLLGNDVPESENYVENSLHVVTGSGTDPTARLDGFTITAGYADGPFPTNRGGGMLNDAGYPTLIDCVFEANRDSGGGGAGMANISSSPTLTRCTFNRNVDRGPGAGMLNVNQSDPSLVDCQFTSNSASVNFGECGSGGAMANLNSNPSLTRCVFMYNTGCSESIHNDESSPAIADCLFVENQGGITNENDSDAIVSNSRFIQNSYRAVTNIRSAPAITGCSFIGNTGGGIQNVGSDATVANCVFSGNIALGGNAGSILNMFSDPVITNCTFTGTLRDSNDELDAAIINRLDSSPTITNCVLWGNRAGQITASEGSAPVVNYSIVQGGWSGADGVGIIDADPLFVDSNGPDDIPGTEDDDLRLLPGSLAIDAGDSGAVPAGVVVDIDGLARFVDDVSTTDTGVGVAPIVDMGAYEFVLGDCNTDGVADLDDHAILDGCLANPDQAFGVGCACLDLDSDGDVDLRDFAFFQMAFVP